MKKNLFTVEYISPLEAQEQLSSVLRLAVFVNSRIVSFFLRDVPLPVL